MRLLSLPSVVVLTAVLSLSACQPGEAPRINKAELVAEESAELNRWFEERFQDSLARSPMTQTYYGVSERENGRLDDVSQLAADETAALQKSWLAEMKREFDKARLDDASKLSYRLFEFSTEDALASHAFSDHDYVFQHMSGPHSSLPSFMMNFHTVAGAEDAERYIQRLEAVPAFMGQHMERAEAQYEKGVSLPRFVYPKIIAASRNVITGAPFTEGPDSPLFGDIKAKIEALDIPTDAKADLAERARLALLKDVAPAYERLIAMFERHMAGASEDDGVWKLPRGEAYYQARLKHYTTTNLTAEQVHALGLKEVERIQNEMRTIMKTIGFSGTLQDFFNHLRSDPKFTYANDDEGRATYIYQATTVINDMKTRLDDLFNTKPKADMIVKRVEPYREDTAFGAFYDSPALDGSRPGTYYINLKDMKELPVYQLQALAYHEGIPGHHMQLAIAQELEGLPKFRTLGSFTPYVEGWALYAESIPGELGLYTDPYQDFGRLSMEIFRAARLVLDTGIHHKQWTREEAVDYMMNNTANSEGDIRAEIDRYIVWPGQATAYKIGMLKIGELRAEAEAALGDRFDIREFHDVILANGAVPLTVLEELVHEWTTQKQTQ